jgi:hypothetical protein
MKSLYSWAVDWARVEPYLDGVPQRAADLQAKCGLGKMATVRALKLAADKGLLRVSYRRLATSPDQLQELYARLAHKFRWLK